MTTYEEAKKALEDYRQQAAIYRLSDESHPDYAKRGESLFHMALEEAEKTADHLVLLIRSMKERQADMGLLNMQFQKALPCA